MTKAVYLFILSSLLVDPFIAYAESLGGSAPKLDSLRSVTQELNEVAKGDKDTQSLLTRNTDPDSVARGSELYSANCVQCHGEGGIGRTKLA